MFDAGSVIGAAIGGGLGLIGTRNANRANADEAAKGREWSERMSNTEYQRRMHDLRAAGLNPMLAFMKGGASTPSAGSTAAMQNELGTAANSAADMRRLYSETERARAEIANMEAMAKKTNAEARILENDAISADVKSTAKKAALGLLTGDTKMRITSKRSPDQEGDKFGLGGLIRYRKKK